jgi:hypothetical protein
MVRDGPIRGDSPGQVHERNHATIGQSHELETAEEVTEGRTSPEGEREPGGNVKGRSDRTDRKRDAKARERSEPERRRGGGRGAVAVAVAVYSILLHYSPYARFCPSSTAINPPSGGEL